MTSIPKTDILTILFMLVDDWYEEEGGKMLRGKAGKKPAREVIPATQVHFTKDVWYKKQ